MQRAYRRTFCSAYGYLGTHVGKHVAEGHGSNRTAAFRQARVKSFGIMHGHMASVLMYVL